MEFTVIVSAALIAVTVSAFLWTAWGVHRLKREIEKVIPKDDNNKQ